MRIAYVVDRHPNYEHAFVVDEILEHERWGCEVEIFPLSPSSDAHFHRAISRVRAPCTRLPHKSVKAEKLWSELNEAREIFPSLLVVLDRSLVESATTLRQAAFLARKVVEREIDHLHAHSSGAPASVARLCSWITGVPYSLTVHPGDSTTGPIESGRCRWNRRHASRVIVMSRFDKVRIDATEDLSDPALLLRPGLDVGALSYETPKGREPRISALLSLDPRGRASTLIDACALASLQDPELSFVFLSERSIEEELRARIRSVGLEERVELAGLYPRSGLLDELRQSSLFVVSGEEWELPRSTALPDGLLEAMAIGTPCIAAEVGGIPDFLQHSKSGFLVPAVDSTALAGAILRLHRAPEEKTRLSLGARQLIEAEFDAALNAKFQREAFQTRTEGQSDALRAHEARSIAAPASNKTSASMRTDWRSSAVESR